MDHPRTAESVRSVRYIAALFAGAALGAASIGLVVRGEISPDQRIADAADATGDSYFRGVAHQQLSDAEGLLSLTEASAGTLGAVALGVFILNGRVPRQPAVAEAATNQPTTSL